MHVFIIYLFENRQNSGRSAKGTDEMRRTIFFVGSIALKFHQAVEHTAEMSQTRLILIVYSFYNQL